MATYWDIPGLLACPLFVRVGILANRMAERGSKVTNGDRVWRASIFVVGLIWFNSGLSVGGAWLQDCSSEAVATGRCFMVRAEDCIERAVKPFDEVCSEIGATLKW